MSPRSFAASILIVAAFGFAGYQLARATMPTPKPDALAEPRSVDQAGLPEDLYRWSIPADNPQSAAKVALGKELFFDPRLSVDNTVACANCHDPGTGFTDQLPTAMGVHAKFGKRNAPTVLNSMFNIEEFWDGRAPTLEAQAAQPILNPVEMGMPDEQTLVAKVGKIAEYQKGFQDTFGAAPSYRNLLEALAAYERTLNAFDAPFDRYMAGDDNALTAQQKRGWAIFNGQGRCMSCHGWNPTRPLFTTIASTTSAFRPIARNLCRMRAPHWRCLPGAATCSRLTSLRSQPT